jgi:hypothetical protein
MSNEHPNVENDLQPQLPPALVKDLKAALGKPVEVPAQVDARIWAAARRHASLGGRASLPASGTVEQEGTRRRTGMSAPLSRWAGAGLAAAAAIGCAVWLSWPARHLAQPTSSTSAPIVADRGVAPLKTPDRVNILDAFTLARNLERRTPVDTSWDVNRDGNIDRQDVDVIAARAVRLEERVIQ